MKPIIFAALLLTTMATATFAIPVQVTNWPANQQVTVTNFPQPTPTPTMKTTSLDILVIDFAGVGTQTGGSAYTTPTEGIAVGNLTAAFSFAPAGIQQINSVTATILHQAGSFYGTCNPCYSGDRFNIKVNGQMVSDTPVAVGVYPQSTVVILGNLHIGSNSINILATNPTAPYPGVYWVYQVRLTVEFTYLG